jgi:hypothetical protein
MPWGDHNTMVFLCQSDNRFSLGIPRFPLKIRKFAITIKTYFKNIAIVQEMEREAMSYAPNILRAKDGFFFFAY